MKSFQDTFNADFAKQMLALQSLISDKKLKTGEA
jgi:hypothetical protein